MSDKIDLEGTMSDSYEFTFNNNDLICCRIGEEEVSFKLGELFGFEAPVMEFEEVGFLNEVHGTDKINENMILQAKEWWERNKDGILADDELAEKPCHCGEAGYYHCSVLREKLREMRSVIQVILEADCLKSHAFEQGDDDCSIYDLCKAALKWPGEEEP